METGGVRRLNRSSPSCLNTPAQRTDFFHGLLTASATSMNWRSIGVRASPPVGRRSWPNRTSAWTRTSGARSSSASPIRNRTYRGEPARRARFPADAEDERTIGCKGALYTARGIVANFRRAPCLFGGSGIRLQASNGRYVVAQRRGRRARRPAAADLVGTVHRGRHHRRLPCARRHVLPHVVRIPSARERRRLVPSKRSRRGRRLGPVRRRRPPRLRAASEPRPVHIAGVQWPLRRGGTRGGGAAWVDRTTPRVWGRFTVTRRS